MIKVKDGYFEMESENINETRKDFGTICISLMKEGFSKEVLTELVNTAYKIITEYGDEIV